jgi:invasion protein IalB
MSIRGACLGWISVSATVFALWCVPAQAAAQTLQPKAQPTPAQKQQQGPAQQVQPPPAAPRPQWEVGCVNTQAGLECRAGQTLSFQQGTNRIQVSAIVQIAPDTRKPNLLLLLPLGTSLPKGVTIQFGTGEAKVLQFQSCSVNGCSAEYPITQAEIASLLQGANLTLSVQAPNKAPISFVLSGVGFAAAYAKVTSQ